MKARCLINFLKKQQRRRRRRRDHSLLVLIKWGWKQLNKTAWRDDVKDIQSEKRAKKDYITDCVCSLIYLDKQTNKQTK